MQGNDDVGVYVHFPWCAKRCPYCDFATTAIDPGAIAHDAYAEAVIEDLHNRRPLLKGRRLFSIFFGGGTPSLWRSEAIGRVVEAIREAFTGREAPDLEVTAECNPTSLPAEKAAELGAAGINRISIGVQSLREQHLRFLGRLHDRDRALAAIGGARQAGVRVSADLMFGMRDQRDVLADVDTLIDQQLSHVSAYALTIESGTQFGTLQRMGKLEVASEDAYARMYLDTEARFEAAGFTHYEVSNYARPGEQARHNQHYWRGGDYLALGAAAVGCFASGEGGARRWRNTTDATAYMNDPTEEWREHLSPDERIQEGLMLGLRTAEGVDLARLQARTGRDPHETRARAIDQALERGDLSLNDAVLRVPTNRWLYLDGIIARLF